MGFRDLIKSGVALADSLTSDLQPLVDFEAWIGQDAFGQAQYAPPVKVRCLVERKQKLIRTAAGNEVMSSHALTILRPLAPNGAPHRSEPVDTRDRFTLADGTTGVILNAEGFDDPVTNAGYFAQVWLAS